MIKTNSLYKKFVKDWVLDDLNLNIKKGEFYCLLGPNGAGKTTTLKLLCGLLKPTKGEAYVGGFNLASQAIAAKQLIGYVPDEPFVYENLTAEEFIEFVGNIFGVSKVERLKKSDYYLELFDLKAASKSLIRDYSHGMRQKLIYTVNLIHEPQVLLVDEPLVGLDPKAIHLVKKILRQKVDQGLTILMSTHLLQIAQELADRVGILHQGKLIAQGTFSELKANMAKETLEDIFLTLTN